MSMRTDSPVPKSSRPAPGSTCSYALIFSPPDWREDKSTRCSLNFLNPLWSPRRLARFTLLLSNRPTRFGSPMRCGPRLEAEQSGFNVLEVRTPARLEAVHAVRIDREGVNFTPSFDPAAPHQFAVQFDRIDQDQTLLEVDFAARVFSYGTTFSGAVSDADRDEVPQSVIPGDAMSELLSEALDVRTPLKGSLLSAAQVVPNPFSPNGDGVNDQVQFSYTLLRLTELVPLETEIYTLAGNRVRTLGSGEGGSALYQTAWDGRDDEGELVAPGLYIYRVAVEAGSGREERLGPIAVVY